MKDRQPTQVLDNGAIRYGIYNADGTLNRYEFMKREDAPTVEGTPLNKANLLSDATAKKIWPNDETRPEDPTVSAALGKLASGTAQIGDIEITARGAPSDNWLPCDGRYITQADYPELFAALRVSASPAPWESKTVTNDISVNADYPRDHISCANGCWFRSVSTATACVLYKSDDLESWEAVELPTDDQLRQTFGFYASYDVAICSIGPVHYYNNQYVACFSAKGYDEGTLTIVGVMYKSSLAGSWALARVDPITEDSGGILAPGYANSDYDVLYGNGVYAIFSEYGIRTSGSPGGTWTGTSWKSINGKYYFVGSPVFNPYDNYWYGISQSSPDYYLMRTQNPAQQEWTKFGNVTTKSSAYPNILCSQNTVFVLADNDTYKYAVNGSAEFTTKTVAGLYTDYYRSGVCTGNLFVLYSPTNSKLFISDDLSSGFQSVDVSGTVRELAANGDIIAGATKSSGSTAGIVTHNFGSDSKRIPNITPDAHSAAYIKALEE